MNQNKTLHGAQLSSSTYWMFIRTVFCSPCASLVSFLEYFFFLHQHPPLLLTVNPDQTASVLSCHFSLMFSLALLGPWGGSYRHHPHSHLSTRGDQRFSYLVQVCCLGIGWLL